MTRKEAQRLLLIHSLGTDEIDDLPLERSFLGMLRPYKGEIFHHNYEELIAAIEVFADELKDAENIERELISALWTICHCTNVWAIRPDGMLRRNSLIPDEQVRQLEIWIDTISEKVLFLLEDAGDQNFEVTS